MSWIGLRDRKRGYFNEAGLGEASAAPVNLNGLLPKGSLLMSFALGADLAGRATTIVEQASTSPWPSTIKISLTKAGDLQFQQTQGDRVCQATLPVGLTSRCQEVILTYTWNAPARRAMLSVEIGDTGETHFTHVANPHPLSLRDAIMLTRNPGGCKLTTGYDFLAVADHNIPHGPLPALCRKTLVPTPKGLVSAGTLRQGDLIIAQDGLTAQIRWTGALTLPSRGRFAPVTARAPFFGATRDLTVASHQRMELSGTEVDYLFANDRVSVRIGDLPSHIVKRTTPQKLTTTYCQFLLDRPTTVKTGGLSIEPLDATPLIQNPALRALSILRDLPSEMMPTRSNQGAPMLQGIETLTLCNLMAA